MAIVAGFDVHRAQITFDALDRVTGEVQRGRLGATPEVVREWAGRFAGEEVHAPPDCGSSSVGCCSARFAQATRDTEAGCRSLDRTA
jgi:hypothetical protein